MKHFLFAIILAPLLCFSQTDKVLSKIEALSTKSGQLLKKEFIAIGELSTYTTLPMQIEILKLTDLKSNVTVSGLKISNAYASSYLDQDEIEGLILSLSKMKEVISQSSPDNYTEYVYLSKTGFRLVIYNGKKGWNFSIDIDKYIIKGLTIFDKGPDNLNKFSELVSKAKNEL